MVRYTLSLLAMTFNLSTWPATLAANLIGCIAIFVGVKLRLFDTISFQQLIGVGLLGGLTTFSTFTLELVQTLRAGQYGMAAAIFFLNIFFGIAIGIGILR